jgi:hypothetical protein
MGSNLDKAGEGEPQEAQVGTPGYQPPAVITIKMMSIAGGMRRAKVIVPPEIAWPDLELAAKVMISTVARAAMAHGQIGFERAVNMLAKDTIHLAKQRGYVNGG